MLAEWIDVPAGTVQQIRRAKQQGRRVVAVGTTVVRALESAARGEAWIVPYQGPAELFITPGFEFQVIDALLTNFHLPRSSLLALVAAFAGRELIMKSYGHAVRAGYRFYSYGDATLIL